MAASRSLLKVAPRDEFGTRSARRLRREGLVPGVVYSGGEQARHFQVPERDVRAVLSEGAALFDLEIEGEKPVPVVIKEQQQHPVRGELQHLDLQQVSLDQKIQADVAIEPADPDNAPGVRAGGVLEHVTREVTVEALPTDIPDRILVDVSELQINESLALSAVTPPEGVTFVAEDPDEITIATIIPPRVEAAEPQVEEEAEGGGESEGEGEAAEGESGDSEESEG